MPTFAPHEKRVQKRAATQLFGRIPVRAKTPAGVQKKLNITAPGDSYEREADRISEEVLRTPERRLQAPCSCGGTCSGCRGGQGGDGHSHSGDSVTHRPAEETVPTVVREALRSPGRPLDSGTRAFMEPRFGHSFADVRVHADAGAALAARSMNARAFTIGKDIFFGDRHFAPGSASTRATLAHELAHVVQQQGAGPMIARQQASFGEKWDAFWDAGPIDAHRAKKLAKESLEAAKQTGLPGPHNGPMDAWRHCYWNCRMVQVIGKEDAKDIADGHEAHGGNSLPEQMMDLHNNEEGRECSGDCDGCCQAKLDAGELFVLYDRDTKVGASKPTPRTGKPSVEKYGPQPPNPSKAKNPRLEKETGFKV